MYVSNWLPYWPGAISVLNNVMTDKIESPKIEHVDMTATHKYVTEEITDVKDFGNAQVILIDAPTGSGKSSFVQKVLSRDAQSKRKKILVLCNRSALNFQNKLLAAQSRKAEAETETEKDNQTIPSIGAMAMDDRINIRNMILCTYQSFLRRIDELAPEEIEYVVFDEAHFFTSDATFNGQTSRIFREILMKFNHSKRIYMSATLDDVRPLIELEEYTNIKLKAKIFDANIYNQNLRALGIQVLAIREYHFKPDFSCVNLHFFENLDCVVQKISNSESKWLIFVSKKESGVELNRSIKNSYFVHASSRQDDPDKIDKMIRREKFSEKVLISTSVFDNGINFKDRDLKNIVIDSEDWVQIVQMLGRKRREAGEQIDLYISLKTDSQIKNRLDYNKNLQRFVERAAIQPQLFSLEDWGELEPGKQKLFDLRPEWQTTYQPECKPLPPAYTSPGSIVYQGTNEPVYRLVINAYVAYQLARLEERYQRILDRFDDVGELALAYEMCERFGKTYQDDMFFGTHHQEEIPQKVRKRLGKCISEAIEEKTNSGYKYKINRSQLNTVATDLRELVRPLIGKVFEQREIHSKNDNTHAPSDIKVIIERLLLPYSLDGRGEEYYFHRNENSDNDIEDSE